MWIECKINKDGSTSYKYYERYNDPITGKNKRVCITLTSNSRQAYKTATKLLSEKITHAIQQAKEKATQESTIYFHQVALEWLEFKVLSCKRTTAYVYKMYCNKIKELFPNQAISQIKKTDIEKAIQNLYFTENYSRYYVSTLLTNIKNIFRFAIDKNYVADNDHIDRIKMPRKAVTLSDVQKKQSKFLDKNELKSLLIAIKGVHRRIGLAMEFMSLTGLRIGELLALRYVDYDQQNKRIHINGNMQQLPTLNGYIRESPKNAYSIRYVSLCNRAIEILEIFRMNNKALAWSKEYTEQGYYFTNEKGSPYQSRHINKVLHKIKSDKTITTHIFRHTHIAMLTELNIPLKTIMQRVGHNDPKTTLSVYSHVTSAMENEVINKLNSLK